MASYQEVTLEVTVPRGAGSDAAPATGEVGERLCPVTAQLVVCGEGATLSVPEHGVPEIHGALLCQLRDEGWTCLGLGRWGRWWFSRKVGS
jgi:hypothetical protein